MLGNAKKHDLDLSEKNGDDIVELMCYLDPRVPYTITGKYLIEQPITASYYIIIVISIL